jgi:hypothetical protein
VTDDPALVAFADHLLSMVPTAVTIVDAGCGSVPTLGLLLRARNREVPVVFVDWNAATLASHEAGYRGGIEAGPTGPSRWQLSPVQELHLEAAWISICRTLPRWPGAPGVHKPRGREDGARLLLELTGTGAQGFSALLSEVEAATLEQGARSLGWPLGRGPSVAALEGEPPMRILGVSFSV